MTTNFRMRRGSSRRSSTTMAPCSSRVTSPLKEKLLEEVADDEENPIKSYGTGNVQTPRAGRRHSGSQNWSNVRAVMAYYCSLRKIKRFETLAGGFQIMEYAKNLLIFSITFERFWLFETNTCQQSLDFVIFNLSLWTNALASHVSFVILLPWYLTCWWILIIWIISERNTA